MIKGIQKNSSLDWCSLCFNWVPVDFISYNLQILHLKCNTFNKSLRQSQKYSKFKKSCSSPSLISLFDLDILNFYHQRVRISRNLKKWPLVMCKVSFLVTCGFFRSLALLPLMPIKVVTLLDTNPFPHLILVTLI